MKKVLKDTCLLASLMILTVFGISVMWSGITAEIALVMQLFVLSFLLSVVNDVFERFITMKMLAGYFAKYLLTTCIVMLFGFIVGWFYRSNFWCAFIYVAIVFVFAYFLDIIETKKDVAFINEKIRERNQREKASL